MIASASEDTTVRVWNFGGALDEEGGALARDVGAESSVVLEGHHKKTTLLRWHPTAENVLLSVSFDLTVRPAPRATRDTRHTTRDTRRGATRVR